MIKVKPHLRSIIDRDGAVILDIPNNAMTTLDAAGAYIWQRLERGLQLKEIAAELGRDTGTDEATIAQDLHTFVEQLKAEHLVVLSIEAQRREGST